MTPARLAESAWRAYVDALAWMPLPGQNRDLFNDAYAVAREWRGVWLACEREVRRLAMCGVSDTAHLSQLGTETR